MIEQKVMGTSLVVFDCTVASVSEPAQADLEEHLEVVMDKIYELDGVEDPAVEALLADGTVQVSLIWRPARGITPLTRAGACSEQRECANLCTVWHPAIRAQSPAFAVRGRSTFMGSRWRCDLERASQARSLEFDTGPLDRVSGRTRAMTLAAVERTNPYSPAAL